MQLAIMSHSQEIIQTAKAVKKEAAELEKTLPQVQEKQKRKKLFIQNVSRQFIEPLNIINGLSNVLQSLIATRDTNTQQQQSVEMQKITATMKHYALHLHRITLMLFDSSDTGHAETERYRRCDRVVCNELGQECVRRTQEIYPVDNVRLESHVSDSLIIQTNRRYMTLTLLELLHNSAKYSDGQHIVLRITQTEKTVRFIVEDVGPGLPKGFEEVVFVPFTKVDDLSEGLGLGLPLCKGHLAHLGGNVSHDASYEQGCRIIVEVPKTE
jgi:signal transduction histidine kinase